MAAIAAPSVVDSVGAKLEHDPESANGFRTSHARTAQARVTAMQSPREILTDVWTSAGGDAAALDAVTLTGEEPQLPSSFRVAAAAQASIAATGLAAARNLEIAQRASRRTSRSTCAMPSSSAAPSVICASTASRRRRPGTPSPASTRPRDAPLRAAAHQFPASPRRRLQGAELQAGARRGAGRADAVGRPRRSRPRPMPPAAWSR